VRREAVDVAAAVREDVEEYLSGIGRSRDAYSGVVYGGAQLLQAIGGGRETIAAVPTSWPCWRTTKFASCAAASAEWVERTRTTTSGGIKYLRIVVFIAPFL
jgi:hypothetical protein